MIRPSPRLLLRAPTRESYFLLADGYTLKCMSTPFPAEELPSSIADALDRGLTVITANQRAARTMRNAFDRRNRAAGLASWQTAAILPCETWVTRLWNQLLIRGRVTEILLNPAQEHALWRSIISADSSLPPSLQSLDSIAELAASAWRLLAQHDGLERLRHTWSTPEHKSFQRWSREFERQCKTQHLTSRAALESNLQRAIQNNQLPLEPIALVGFDEMLPAQKALTSAISSTGSTVETLNLVVIPDEKLLVSTPEEIDEIAAAARWARNLLIANPNARIAVIASALEDRRDEIDRTFREILAPELENILAKAQPAPCEFSVGTPLARTAMARVAFDLLSWIASPLSVERVSALLVSPLFAMHEEERGARAAFDAYELRKAKLLRPQITLEWLADALAKSGYRPQLQRLRHVLASMMHSRPSSTDEPRSHSHWAHIMRTWLQTAEWGRSTGEDSVEFQTRRKWESTLDLLATLDFAGRKLSFSQALLELERLLQQTIFAPESNHAPVQVMGPLEASGSNFDALWFLNAGDLSWPVRSTANALLPWSVQRELSMPGANPAAEELRTGKMTARLAASARQVIFSYPKNTTDGRQRPSPLLRSLDLQTIEMHSLVPPDVEAEPVTLEEFSDQLPVAPLPELSASGGVEVIKLQAACAFRAFAEKRLGSAELRDVELGMDARELGSVLHRILEHFWNHVRSQEALKQMSEEERNATIRASVDHGLHKTQAIAETVWEQAYVSLQRKRLISLVERWLTVEMRRTPFIVKESEQQIQAVKIGPLQLNLRVDRVDIAEEAEIIIDYKTGGARAAQWEGARPDEPQLPLYAIISRASHPETPPADIAFAQVRAGKEMGLETFSEKVTTLKTIPRKRKISFEEQLDHWRQVLEDLAIKFHSGHAEVDPKHYPETCKHCAQRILCRLNTAAFDEELDEETSVDAGNG